MSDVADRQPLFTSAAPQAAVGDAQGVSVAGRTMIFCAGQIALDPTTQTLVADGDPEQQTHRVMQNLAAVLTDAGVSWSDVVRTTIQVTDLDDLQLILDVYGQYVPASAPPVTTAFQVAALPKGAMVQIEATAVTGSPGSSLF